MLARGTCLGMIAVAVVCSCLGCQNGSYADLVDVWDTEALDMAGLEQRFIVSRPKPGFLEMPTRLTPARRVHVLKRALLVETHDDRLIAYNRSDGRHLWAIRIGRRIQGRIRELEREPVAFLVAGANILEINVERGETSRRIVPDFSITGDCDVAAGLVFVSTSDGLLAALKRGDGAESVSLRKNVPLGSPRHQSGTVFVGSRDRHIYGMDRATGREVRKFATFDNIIAPVVPRQRVLFCAGSKGYVYAIPAMPSRQERDEALWTYSVESAVIEEPLLLDDTLYVTTLNKGVTALNAQTGKLVYTTPDAVQFMARGKQRDYLLSRDRTILLVDRETAEVTARLDAREFRLFGINASDATIFLVAGEQSILALGESGATASE